MYDPKKTSSSGREDAVKKAFEIRLRAWRADSIHPDLRHCVVTSYFRTYVRLFVLSYIAEDAVHNGKAIPTVHDSTAPQAWL